MLQHPPRSPDESHGHLPVSRIEYVIVLGQLGGLTTKVDLMWEEIKKTASAETVEKVEKIQKAHHDDIIILKHEMSSVKEEVKKGKFSAITDVVVVIYESVFAKVTPRQVKSAFAIAILAIALGITYWATALGGARDYDDQDHRQKIEQDSIAHAHKMDMMRMQIEFQRATRRAPTNITIERSGEVVGQPSESDSLSSSFGIDPPLYPPTPIDAP